MEDHREVDPEQRSRCGSCPRPQCDRYGQLFLGATLVDVMKKTIGDFIANGPTDEELQAAKNNLVNGFPLRIDSNRKILDNVSSIAWNDLPLDTLDQWTNELRKVTKEQVIAAFRKNLDVNQMVTVVVGAP